MATRIDALGVVATAVNAGGVANKVLQGLINGRVKSMHDQYTLAGTEATASTIKLGSLIPKGSRIIEILLYVSASQTSLTYQLGTSYNADEFVATGATGLQTGGSLIRHFGKNYIVGTATGDDQIVLLTEGATATAGTLYAVVIYAQD